MADLKYTVQVDTRGATKNVEGLGNALGGLKKLGIVAAAAAIGKALFEVGQVSINASKKFETYTNQLKLITDGSEDLTRVMGLLTEAAVKNRTSFESTIDLFTKLTLATAELGKSEEDVIEVTAKLSQALAIAGADAQTTNSVIRQFGQAMASGTVRGDEFNSIVEGLGPALAIMARETGLNVGTLRKMSREGELTADVMFDMIQKSEALSAAFNQTTVTTDQLEVALGDAFTRAAKDFAESTGLAEKYRDVLQSITRILDGFSGAQGLTNLALEDFDEALRTGRFSARDLRDELVRDIGDINTNLTYLGSRAEKAEQRLLEFNGASPVEMLRALTDGTYEAGSAFMTAGHLLREVTAYFNENVETGDEAIERYQTQARTILELIDRYTALADAEEEENKRKKEEFELQEKLDKAYKEFIPQVDGLAEALNNIEQFMDESNADTYLSAFEKAQKDFEEAEATVRALEQALSQLPSSGLDDIDARVDNLNEDLVYARQALKYYGDALADAKVKQAELDEELRRAGLTEYQRYLEDIIEAAKETVTETENQARAVEELKQKMIADPDQATIYQQAIDDILGTKDAYDQLRDSIGDIEGMDDFEAVQSAINQAFEDGKISLQEYKDLLPTLQDKFEELNPTLMAFFESVEQAGNALADNLAEDLVEGRDVLDSFKNFFKSIVKQMIAEAIKLLLIRQLLTGIFGLFGYAPTFGAGATVTGISKIPIPGKASGGPVQANSPYMVGEKGPELFVPNTSGNIVPNDQLSAGGPVTNNYITNNINAVDAKSVAQLFAENRQALLGTVEYARKETAYGV